MSPPTKSRDERGTVTAEAALTLPVLVVVTLGLVWMVSLAADQVRVVDAAREGARAAARGDDSTAARQVAETVAPAGAQVSIAHTDDEVQVTVQARVSGPGGVLGRLGLPAVLLHARAVGVAEPSGGGGGP